MEDVKSYLEDIKGDIRELKDSLEGKYVTKSEFDTYKQNLELLHTPGDETHRMVKEVVIKAVVYALLVGIMLVIVTYINQVVLHVSK